MTNASTPAVDADLEITEEVSEPASLPSFAKLSGDPEPEPTAKPSKNGKDQAERSEDDAEDFDARYKSDPEFKAFVDRRANALYQRNRDRADKKARLTAAVADESGKAAIAEARQELEAIEQEDQEERRPAQANLAAFETRVKPFLEHLANDPEFAPHYAAFFRREGRKAIDQRLSDDAVTASRWIFSEVTKLKVEAEKPGAIDALAKARANDETARSLRDVPKVARGEGTGAPVFRNRHELERAFNEDRIDYYQYKALKERLDY